MEKSFVLIFILHIAGFAISASDLLAARSYCGYQYADDYISNEIKLDEFPWVAQILRGKEKQIYCTGSLINNRYVLTAAHCLTPQDKFMVRLGNFVVINKKDCVKHHAFAEECTEPAEEFEMEDKILHPEYDEKILENDIGLIRLSTTVEYSEFIRPICLPLSKTLQLDIGEKLATSKWGFMDYGGKQTKAKKKIIATLIPIEDCQKSYQSNERSISITHNFCSSENGSYTCQGDSGGPLMKSSNKYQWEQVGLLLFEKSRCEFPSVYINVANYIDWIKSNLRE